MINQGIALGWWQGVPVWVVVLAWGAVLILAVKTRELWERIGLGLVLIGGALNLQQRFSLGGVEDPWSLAGMVYNNRADYLIFFGILIYGYTYFVRGRRHRRD